MTTLAKCCQQKRQMLLSFLIAAQMILRAPKYSGARPDQTVRTALHPALAPLQLAALSGANQDLSRFIEIFTAKPLPGTQKRFIFLYRADIGVFSPLG